MPQTFEENYQLIVDTVNKYHTKWRLNILHWMDYEDVSSEIVTHVWKKWHLWDQARPLAPWVAQVCTNQIWNKIRNNYTNYARPCIKCPNNLEGTHCSVTSNHEQCAECPIYAKWLETKKSACDIKMPLELENHSTEVNNMPSDEINYDLVLEKLQIELDKHLDEKSLRMFQLFNFENVEEKDMGAILGLKSRPNCTIAQQVSTLKDTLYKKVKKILKDSDIPELWR
jgi:DNA-directed RNA polymerase specialized sigma24 family protein